MKINPQTMIAILLAGGAVKASNEQFFVPKAKLNAWNYAYAKDIPQRLWRHGILMPTPDGNVFLLNPENMRNLSDAESLLLLRDLSFWLSNQSLELKSYDWREMKASSQDYSSGM